MFFRFPPDARWNVQRSVAERKVRRRQLTDDGNVEITGRDLRERESRSHHERLIGYRRAAS
jgi:hypothetical protein